MSVWIKILSITGSILMLLMVNACSLKAIQKQSIELESLAKISGKIVVKGEVKHAIIVAAITYKNDKVIVIDQSHVDKNGAYHLYLLPGKYLVAAYIDNNSNMIRDSNESAAIFKKNDEHFTEVTLTNKQTLILDAITIDPEQKINTYKTVQYNTNKIKNNIGRVTSLDEAIFAKANSKMGLWRPIDFLKQIGGGLMFLQPFDKDKTPVIFIHGLSGNPTEFKQIINQLNPDKFQPWVLYYPSGLPLDLVSNYMVKSLTTLHERYNFNELQLVSHSMGGLICRDFLRLQQTKKLPFEVSLYITINSPMYGLDNAARSVKESPIVLASWRDLATNSHFIKSLHQWTMPSSIPYHLFFSYLPGKDGDGNVPMRSQLSLSLQDEAEKIHATQGSHAGVLQDKNFIDRLIKVIEASRK